MVCSAIIFSLFTFTSNRQQSLQHPPKADNSKDQMQKIPTQQQLLNYPQSASESPTKN